MNDGLTTIEEAREKFRILYDRSSLRNKLVLKCWMYHSESRNRNGNLPFDYYNYTMHLRNCDIKEQIELKMIDCEDIGGVEVALKVLE